MVVEPPPGDEDPAFLYADQISTGPFEMVFHYVDEDEQRRRELLDFRKVGVAKFRGTAGDPERILRNKITGKCVRYQNMIVTVPNGLIQEMTY